MPPPLRSGRGGPPLGRPDWLRRPRRDRERWWLPFFESSWSRRLPGRCPPNRGIRCSSPKRRDADAPPNGINGRSRPGLLQKHQRHPIEGDSLAVGRSRGPRSGRREAELVALGDQPGQQLLQCGDGLVPRASMVFEREALASLERALDRRRYFLRTLPDRSRIDVTRRLTGTRTEARSWLRDQSSPAGSTSMTAHRRVMRELVSAAAGTASLDAALAARVAAIDPAADRASAGGGRDRLGTRRERPTGSDRRRDAGGYRPRVANAASHEPLGIRNDALAGSLADELRRKQ